MPAPQGVTEYEHRTVFSRNPLARLSHRARIAEALALIDRYLPQTGVMLDFGCAQGQLLAQARARMPGAVFYGLDPFRAGTGYTHLRSPTECEGLSFDVITAFEVLEHLDESGTESFFRLVACNLTPEGVCIVSVPNMLGPALLPKLLHTAVFSGSALNYHAVEALRAAALLKSPSRLPPDTAGTMRHKGYDWRRSRDRIASEFTIVSEKVTPFPRLWWGLNSQWFCLFRQRSSRENR